MNVQLPQLVWYGNTALDIDLPERWQVEICAMQGAARPAMTADEMAAAINNPVGAPAIRDLAKEKKSAVIIIDDMTRPTRTYQLAPIVINELAAAGLAEEDITFVCALGAHGALTQNEFRKKLGRDILERFRVFNHNCYEHCVNVGTTSYGTPVMINREVVSADFKIGIGCVTAHAQTGFSGGGKLLMPGVAHIDTISHYHLDVNAQAPETTGLGKHENNILRANIEEAARLAGMDFKIDVLFNGRGETSALFAGEPSLVHERAVALAKDVYATDPHPKGKDLVIANAFAKANEMPIALGVGGRALKRLGGTVVIIANSPEGQVVHYLLGRFGRNHGGRQYPVSTIAERIDLIIMAPYLDKTFADWFSNPQKVTWTRAWPETLAILQSRFPDAADVAVIPNATMQYYKQP